MGKEDGRMMDGRFAIEALRVVGCALWVGS